MDKGIQYINGFHPVDTYFNGKQIAGSVPKVVSGDGHVEWESPYNVLKEVKLLGKSEQQTFTGKNHVKTIKDADTTNKYIIYYGTTGGYPKLGCSLKANTAYTISFWVRNAKQASDGTWGICFWFRNKDDGVLYPVSSVGNSPFRSNWVVLTDEWIKLTYTFTNDFPVDEVSFGYYASGKALEYDHNRLQIEEGDIATEYEPYVGGIRSPNPDYPQEVKGNNGVFVCGDSQAVAPELYAIGDYKDEWNPQTGKGLRRIGKVELKGGGYWSATGTRVFTSDVILSNALPHTNMNTVANILCSHYEAVTNGITFYNSKIGISYYSRTLSFSFGTGTTYTVAEWTAHLKELYDAGTPITIYYALAEPVPFETEPMPLTCPVGYGQLIQLDGNIADCPVEVTYLESMG